MGKRTNKTHKLRGSREHGRGKKKGRGAGLRGGRGHAGSFGHKILHYRLYDTEHFDRKGFNRPQQVFFPQKAITLQHLEERVEELLAAGSASRDADAVTIDLGGIGYNKLLGTGSVERKFRIKVDRASAQAVERVKAAGGDVTVLVKPKPAPAAGGAKPAPKPPTKPAAKPASKPGGSAADRPPRGGT